MNNTKENENNQQNQTNNQNNSRKQQQTENQINSQPQRKTQSQQSKPQTAQTTNQQINQNQQRQNEEEEVTTMPEKKTIVYLIILTLVLIFIALFFICDIVDRGKINATETTTITYPDNDVIIIDDGGNNGNTGNKGNTTKVIDADASLKIFEGTKEWSELKELDIFNRNHNHVVNGKIAPGVEETYIYTVECYGDYNMLYDMQFFDENPLNINMKFKLRRNGKFVAGDENTWVTVDQLKQAGMKIAPKTIDVFILDWRWEDADNDTEIGETEGAQYKLNIKSNAEAIIEN